MFQGNAGWPSTSTDQLAPFCPKTREKNRKAKEVVSKEKKGKFDARHSEEKKPKNCAGIQYCGELYARSYFAHLLCQFSWDSLERIQLLFYLFPPLGT